jgi:16S rRNA processing protein RimM
VRSDRGGRKVASARASPSQAPRRVCVAQIGAPHGVRGEVRLKSFTADPDAVARYGPLQAEDGRRSFEIEAMVRQDKDAMIVRLRGIDDRNAAEALRNLRLYVPRERLPETEDSDTFYHADLIGLKAVDTEGVPLGTVTAVYNFGAGDLIEVAPPGGGETVLLPFTESVVPTVDLAAGRIVVNPPELAQGSADIPARQGKG